MTGRRMFAGTVLAVIMAGSWAVVATGGHDRSKQGPPAKQNPAPKKGPHDNHESNTLDAILATQRRLLNRLDTLQDETLPNQFSTLHGSLVDAIAANQGLLLEAIGGLQLQCSMADVLPLPEPGHTGDTAFCRFDDTQTMLRVQVYNQGGVAAGPFTTRVTFGNGAGVAEQLSPVGLPAFNGSSDLLFSIPPSCYPNSGESSCVFTIGVDIGNQVPESNEINNTVAGRCIRVG